MLGKFSPVLLYTCDKPLEEGIATLPYTMKVTKAIAISHIISVLS
jgi:hypothetical protein